MHGEGVYPENCSTCTLSTIQHSLSPYIRSSPLLSWLGLLMCQDMVRRDQHASIESTHACTLCIHLDCSGHIPSFID